MQRALTLAVVLGLMVSCSTTTSKHDDPPAAAKDPVEKLNWRLGVQAWTFRKLSLYEAIDRINGLGLHYIEMYPGQKLSPDSNVKADHNMPAEQIDQLIAKLKSAKVTPVSYGVVDVGGDEKSARKVFDFAKKLGLEQIVSEPKPEMIAMLDNLTAEYGIKLAIHDHPKPSRYWNPDAVLQVLPGRSERIGACADVGHWYRSGLVPVECLKRLQGRIIEFHMKDVNEAKEDVVWGTGKVDIRGVMEEVRRQGVRNPLFAIEYEKGEGEELIANVSKSIEYFRSVAAELATKK